MRNYEFWCETIPVAQDYDFSAFTNRFSECYTIPNIVNVSLSVVVLAVVCVVG